MFRTKPFLLMLLVATSIPMFVPAQADAGPLLDWILGRRARRTQPWTVQNRVAYPHNAAAIAASANGCLQPGVCQVNCQRTCQRTVVNYVPQTCYRTQWQRIPVTQYRPVTNTDPCSGCTVTCMRPCTTYRWQAQRVPYTTYRPVYRTETYRVPVTYYTSDCGNVNPCASCNAGTQTSGPAFNNTQQPTPATPPAGGVNTSGAYVTQPGYYNTGGQSTIGGGAADTVPSLVDPTSAQRPLIQKTLPTVPDTSQLIDVPNLNSTPMNYSSPIEATPLQAPENNLEEPVLIRGDKQARALIHKKWNYTPVRLASYETEVVQPRKSRTYVGKLKIAPEVQEQKTPQRPNAIWQAK